MTRIFAHANKQARARVRATPEHFANHVLDTPSLQCSTASSSTASATPIRRANLVWPPPPLLSATHASNHARSYPKDYQAIEQACAHTNGARPEATTKLRGNQHLHLSSRQVPEEASNIISRLVANQNYDLTLHAATNRLARSQT